MKTVKNITIERAEGPSALCGVKKEFTSFADASAWLIRQADTFPKRGYDKHDFSVEFEGGLVYEGRLDCKHYSCPDNDLDVRKHIVDTMKWYAGRTPYPHCGAERYAELVALYRKDGLTESAVDWLDNILEGGE